MSNRLTRIVQTLATLLVLYSLVGFFIVPGIGLRIANQQLNELATVPAHLQRLQFNPFTLEVDLWGLSLNTPEPVVAFEHLRVNAETDSLWQQQIHLAEIELTGSHVHIARNSDGSLNLANLFKRSEAAPKSESKPLALSIDRLVIAKGDIHFTDLASKEPVQLRYQDINFTLNNLNTQAQKQALLNLTAHSAEVGELRWQGTLGLSPLSSQGELSIAGLNLASIGSYISHNTPLTLERGLLSVSTAYQFSLGETLSLDLDELSVHLQDTLINDPQKNSLLQLAQLTVKDAAFNLSEKRVLLPEINSQDLKLWTAREKDGQINWQRLFAKEDSEQTPESSEVNAPWQIILDQAHLAQSHIYFQDQQPKKAVKLHLSPLDLKVNSFDSLSDKPFVIDLQSTLNQQGSLKALGHIGLNPVRVALDVTTQNIDTRLAQSYLDPLVKLEVRSGHLDSQLKVSLSSTNPLKLAVTGDAQLTQLHTLDGLRKRDLLKWHRLAIQGLNYEHDQQLAINKLILDKPYVRFVINENLSTNISELIIAQPSATSSAPSKPLPINIGGIEVNQGSAHFSDFSLTPHFATAIQTLDGHISAINNQVAKPTTVNLQGKVDTYAPVSIKGFLTPFDPLNQLDIATHFKHMELTTLTPYSGKFAGYRIHKGRLSLDLHYQIQKGQLQADNKLLLENLQLGERVDSPDAVNLPVRLAVALLKDTQGNIDIALPIKGDLNNPEFSVMPIVWQTLQNLVLRATQAPFKFIAGLAGGSGEGLNQVRFAPGSSELDVNASQNLATLAKALHERPTLRLEIAGQSSAEVDGQLLAQARLESLFQQKQYQLLQERGKKVPASFTELEVSEKDKAKLLLPLYVDRFKSEPPASWQALDKEERHTKLTEAIVNDLATNAALLRALSEKRAAAIKTYLIEEQRLPNERIYLIDSAQTQADSDGWVASVLNLGG